MALGLLGTALAGPASPQPSRQAAPDINFSNGKIITADEPLTIARAVAVEEERNLAVGDEEIEQLAGPDTRRIDLKGRAVTPGLIDSHMHLFRAGVTWQREVRWDGIDSWKRALDTLRGRADASIPGQRVFNLGGWTRDQFADDKAPFTREELGRVAPTIRSPCRRPTTRRISAAEPSGR